MLCVAFGIDLTELVGLEFVHSLGENLLIGIVSHIGNEAALLGTEHVSCSSDVEILHGYVYATAKTGVVLYGLQTTTGFGGKGRQWWRQQIAECLLVATSHTSAHLVQVAESEVLCIVYDYGVGIGYVYAILYDGG